MALTKQTNTTLEEIAQVMDRNQSFVICGHVGPDGDCLGSQLALAHVLIAKGKDVEVILAANDPIEPSLSIMPGFERFIPSDRIDVECDVFVGVDVPTRERIGEAAARLLDKATTSVTIDHHAVDTTMCQYVYVDPDAASTSILIWQLACILMENPPIECAQCAYTGLVSDTGCFQYQNVDERAFSIASQLVAAGAQPEVVARETMHNRTLASLRLESRVIERMELLNEGKCALSWVTAKDMSDFSAEKSDTDALINVVRQLQGLRVACVLREQGDLVKGSLRAKDDTDVSVLARKLGGGGHKAAAGFTVDGPLDSVLQTMRNELAVLFQEQL